MISPNIKVVAMVAMTSERVIGKDNDLPWHLPEDLKLFKAQTSGFPIVMGRKTWESIGRPLPNRRNIVITRNPDWSAEGAEVINSIESLEGLSIEQDKVFIIGGAEIYSAFLPIIDELLVSKVKKNYEGNTKFPEFESLFSKEEVLQQFEEFDFVRYSK
ncbi:dihydrofolate reductase [Akkermansiaceae bacterium]|nr:dihydrofolate reductase [Akkermansiaceae bacterium]